MSEHNATEHYKKRLKIGDIRYVYDPVVRNHLKQYFEGKRCLDLGCGSGYYLKMMGPGSVGYDASIVNVEHGSKSNLDIRLMNLDDWPGEEKEFDVIFASHVLEHLLSPVRFIEKCSNSLQKGNVLIIGVPTEHTIDRLLYDYGFNDDVRHFYAFSPNNLKYLLERQGFKITKRYVSYTMMGRIKSEFVEKTLQNMIPFRIGIFFSKGYYFVCDKI